MVYRKEIGIVPIICGILIAVLAAFFFVILPNMSPSTNLRLGDGVFKARIVSKESDRAYGLKGVTSLDPDQALLMVFPSQDKWTVSIKDIKIPIDIVWLNSDKRVVYIVQKTSPGNSISDEFIPKFPAKYVIELPAGTVESKTIGTVTTAVFQTNSIQGQ